MTAWELLDEKGRVRKLVVGPRHIAEQFESAELTLRRAWVRVRIPPSSGRADVVTPLELLGRERQVRPVRVPRVTRIGSPAARAKRQRLRARLEGAGSAAFIRLALAALIQAGALDHFEEE